MLLSAMSLLVVVQLSSEIPEGLMNNPVYVSVKHISYYIKLIHGNMIQLYWIIIKPYIELIQSISYITMDFGIQNAYNEYSM